MVVLASHLVVGRQGRCRRQGLGAGRERLPLVGHWVMVGAQFLLVGRRAAEYKIYHYYHYYAL